MTTNDNHHDPADSSTDYTSITEETFVSDSERLFRLKAHLETIASEAEKVEDLNDRDDAREQAVTNHNWAVAAGIMGADIDMASNHAERIHRLARECIAVVEQGEGEVSDE